MQKSIKFDSIFKPNGFKDNDIFSLQALYVHIEHAINTCKLNNINPDNVPTFISNSSENKDYNISIISQVFGEDNKFVMKLNYYNQDVIDYYNCEDVRPGEISAEYWNSRGPGYNDVSGYIKSKEAGLRLLRLVKYILEKDEIESYLDWREYEPNYIQFKFSAKEFDCKKLHEMSKGIINEKILRACIK